MSSMSSMSSSILTPQQISTYYQNGYLVLDNFISEYQCHQLRNQAYQIVNQRAVTAKARNTFTTEQNERDEFFLKSGDNISLFFEPTTESVNKIGHTLHLDDSVFKDFSYQPAILSLIRDLGLTDPLMIQSMFIFKSPRIGGKVDWHQDGTFLYTEPDTSIGLWFALEDATLENGCLWVAPGNNYPLRQRFIQTPDRKTKMIDLQDSHDLQNSLQIYEQNKVPLEVKKGTLVVLHSRLPHMSLKNESPNSRHAYTLHFIDKNSSYPADNWLHNRYI